MICFLAIAILNLQDRINHYAIFIGTGAPARFFAAATASPAFTKNTLRESLVAYGRFSILRALAGASVIGMLYLIYALFVEIISDSN